MKNTLKWCACFALVFSVVAYGGPRVDQATIKYEDLKVVKVEPPIEGPLTVPEGLEAYRHKLQPLPQGVPLVTYEIRAHNGEYVRPGDGSIATLGSAAADVFRQNNDSGYFLPIRDDVNAWNASLAVFGGGFAAGNAINGYDLLTFNSSGNSGTSVVTAMLWDGDPLGWLHTQCSAGGVPALIPGTMMTFPPTP
jgi:hypothetical protein